MRLSQETRRYTDLLSAIAWSQPIGVTAIARSPRMRLYAYLGQDLARDKIPEHRYGEWIRTYSSPEFEQFAQTLEKWVNLNTAPSASAPSTISLRDALRVRFLPSRMGLFHFLALTVL